LRVEYGCIHLSPAFVETILNLCPFSLDGCLHAEFSDVCDISLPPIPGVPNDKMASGRAQRDQVFWICGQVRSYVDRNYVVDVDGVGTAIPLTSRVLPAVFLHSRLDLFGAADARKPCAESTCGGNH
jgi:hypothetical protein